MVNQDQTSQVDQLSNQDANSNGSGENLDTMVEALQTQSTDGSIQLSSNKELKKILAAKKYLYPPFRLEVRDPARKGTSQQAGIENVNIRKANLYGVRFPAKFTLGVIPNVGLDYRSAVDIKGQESEDEMEIQIEIDTGRGNKRPSITLRYDKESGKHSIDIDPYFENLIYE